jgi:outer membrane protein assembly factor BamB
LRKWLLATDLGEDEREIVTSKSWARLQRGRLPGAGDWSHQYGDVGNTSSSMDARIKGGLGVLWYGDPGPGMMVNRHEGAVGPVAVNGRLIVQGQYSVLAYDAYNGLFLWEYKNPDTYRTGVFQNWNPSNLVAGDNSVFIMDKDKVVELDAATGTLKANHTLPPAKAKDHEWGFVAYQDGILFGTATIRTELIQRLRRRGRKFEDATDAIFAIDTKTGKYLWTYQGKSISDQTIALGSKQVYFIDSTITSEQRADLLQQDKTELKKLKGEAAKEAEERMKRLDARLAVALDVRTGKKAWEKPVDVTDCSEIGTGGGKLTLMHHAGVLILGGANANGHYWQQFVAGEFSRRRLVALSARNGKKLWARDGNYRHRPIIIASRVIAEPWAFDLYTGKQETRLHPLTGKPEPWSMLRPGHHCGMLTGCPNMLLFRSGSTGFYDLYEDAGTRHFAGHRLGCWINAIPANGLVMIPEASAGCVCLFSIASTIVLEPRPARRPWTIVSAVGSPTPVERMCLNLGAPGDRKDDLGTIWLSYPRPVPGKVTGLDLKLKLEEQLLAKGKFDSISARSANITGTDTPWLFSSHALGLRKCSLPLLGQDDRPADYTVTLFFAELDQDTQKGQRVFDVKIQGKTVLKDFDILAGVGSPRKALERTFEGIHVTDRLVIELIPKAQTPTERQLPVLNAIQVRRAK